MSEFWVSLKGWVQDPQIVAGAKAVLILLAGLVAATLVRRWLKFRRFQAHHAMILSKAASVLVLALAVVWALRELGLDMGVLLGAAGILTVAVGFASQTSASNLISGLFLMGEGPFQVGDIIQIGQTTGEVLSIDFLSVKLRTFDNLMVRIPNETLLKSELTNLTRFPIRRVDLKIGVAYKEDLERVRDLVLSVSRDNPLCLDEPEPLFIFLGFGDSALEFQFSVWAVRKNFLNMRTSLWLGIKQAFDREGIEIPFPHVSFYTGSQSEPLPIQLIGAGAGGTERAA